MIVNTTRKRLIFGSLSAVLLGVEIIIGMFAHGWVGAYLGDVLVVVLIYTLIRTVSPEKPRRWYILPAGILIFSFAVEFLQLWGFCDRLGIENRLLRIIIGTGFSGLDLVCYSVGLIPVFIAEYYMKECKKKDEG